MRYECHIAHARAAAVQRTDHTMNAADDANAIVRFGFHMEILSRDPEE